MRLPETAALAASMIEANLTESGKIGRVDTKTVSRDDNGEFVDIGDFGSFQRVSDEPINLKNLSSVFIESEGLEGSVTRAEFTLYGDPGVQACVTKALSGSENALVFSFSDNNEAGRAPGVYLFKQVASATFETIHPIDPKYLPGVYLPVVELSTVVDVMAVEGTALTEAEVEQIKRVSEKSDYALFVVAMSITPEVPTPVICKRMYTVDDGWVCYASAVGTVLHVVGVSKANNVGLVQISTVYTDTAGAGEGE